jgi:hypothetical protein
VTKFPDAQRPRRDSGVTLLEILIAITLLAGVIAGTMAALQATTMSGELHRDHARAHAWLQSASDVLYAEPKTHCDGTKADQGEKTVRDAYDLVIDKLVKKPSDWESWQLQVVPPVKFWNSANLDADPDPEFFFGSACDPNLQLQDITLQVKSPSGRIIETVEIVK